MKKAILLALAAASVMMFALPVAASANTWDMDWGNHAEPLPFTINQETTTNLTTKGSTVTCTKVTGSGSYTTTTTGSVQLTFHGCKSSGVNCTTSGQSAGTIKTTVLPFHNVYAEHPTPENNNTVPGILITPGEGNHFASFGCTFFGIGAHVVVTGGGGNGGGVIGEVEKCGKLTESFLKFEKDAEGNQTLRKWTNKEYDLAADVNGAEETAVQEGTGAIKFPEEVEATCKR